ncbi:hypothetical protein [Haloarcula japonica]|uniref:DUF7827 domain-containing protein n=1 Tax=Haloarcula japonica TaxID=29282 RepID=UPI000678133B|nr:hypothetical protein [Haloarcula japonica]
MSWIARTSALLFIFLIVTSVASSATTGQIQSRSQGTVAEAEIHEEVGDIVKIPIRVPPYNTTTLNISGEQYSAEVTATDQDGDGQIQLRVNTFETQTSGNPSGYSVASPDHLREVSQRGHNGLTKGEYAISVDGNTSKSTLLLKQGTFQPGQLHTLPNDRKINKSNIMNDRSPVPSQIAHDDILIAEFEAEGIMGVGRFDNPPGNNGIVAADSAVGAQTTHTVQVQGTDANTSFRKVRINYDNAAGETPAGLVKLNITHAGIDSDQDGQIDRSFKPSIINVKTNSEGIIEITSSGQQTVSKSETIILQYEDVTNPSRPGTYPATVMLGSDKIDTTVEYGPAATGNLGNGLNVNANTTSLDGFVAPLPFKYFTSPANDRLYVAMDTGGLDNMTGESISLTLSQFESGESISTKRSVTNASLVEPTANVMIANDRWQADSEPLQITGTTTLAPNSNIWIRVRSAGDVPSPWIYHYTTSVRPNRTFEIDITENRIGTNETVYVRPVTRSGPIGSEEPVRVINATD